MTIDRPYQKGMLLPEALKRIKELVGTRYDAEVVNALIRGCEASEIGQGVVRFMVNAAAADDDHEDGIMVPQPASHVPTIANG
jgi:hypothetical protein